jgi:hypothetical protein
VSGHPLLSFAANCIENDRVNKSSAANPIQRDFPLGANSLTLLKPHFERLTVRERASIRDHLVPALSGVCVCVCVYARII